MPEWEVWLHVVKIGNKFIAYNWAETDFEKSAFRLGWEFNWDTVVEVFPKEITRTIYVIHDDSKFEGE